MGRPLLWSAAVCALWAILAGPLAAADDVALSYDQIERVLPADAGAPGPDAFAENEEQTRAAILRPPADKRGRKGGAGALATLTDDLRAAGFPRLQRHVFYRGWERIEDLVTGTIVLRKCDQGMLVTIDSVRKTYRLDDPAAVDRERLTGAAARQRSGTASLDVVRSVERGPSRAIDGVNAEAYRSSQTLRVDTATGSCRVTTLSAQTQTYYAPFAAPVSTCPRPAPDFPASPLAAIARDGCRPSVAAHVSGTVEPSASLVLYRSITLAEARDRLVLLLARGNFRTIVNAAALFDIPAGYTKT